MDEILDSIQLDAGTMQDACLNYCGQSRVCKWYQFEQDKCPKIREVKRKLVLGALEG